MKYKGVICFSAIDWFFLKQRVHYIMGELAARGMKVLFIENTGARNPGIRDLPRLMRRLKNASGIAGATGDMPQNIEIFSPMALPFPYNYPAILYNTGHLNKRIDSFLRKNNLLPVEVIFWTYLATPVVVRLAESRPWGRIVYDLVSDPKLVEPRLEPHEKKLLQKAGITLFASYALYEQYCKQTENPCVFEDGFNTELLGVENKPCPMDSLPKPVFLYIGGINRKIWAEMIETLAKSFPGGSVVLIGPRDHDIRLPDLPNLHIYPEMPGYADLAAYLARADAGIIPYYNDKYSGVMHPAKLNEYLVFGLPVVATATPELQLLDSHWGGKFLYLGADPAGFARAAAKALEEDNMDARERRKKFTRLHAWPYRIEELLGIIGKTH